MKARMKGCAWILMVLAVAMVAGQARADCWVCLPTGGGSHECFPTVSGEWGQTNCHEGIAPDGHTTCTLTGNFCLNGGGSNPTGPGTPCWQVDDITANDHPHSGPATFGQNCNGPVD